MSRLIAGLALAVLAGCDVGHADCYSAGGVWIADARKPLGSNGIVGIPDGCYAPPVRLEYAPPPAGVRIDAVLLDLVLSGQMSVDARDDELSFQKIEARCAHD